MSDDVVFNDPYLIPHAGTIRERRVFRERKEKRLTADYSRSLYTFADYHTVFGLHKTGTGWVFREWAPAARAVYLIGDMTGWTEDEAYRLEKTSEDGIFEKSFPEDMLHHGDYFKLKMVWDGGRGERIPTAANRVVQDPETLIFSAQVWHPETPYEWQCRGAGGSDEPLLVYEAHPGIATEEGRVGTFHEFEHNVIPRIKTAGYNTVQLMAVLEHPYYGSFGYHVSSFFAPSSRFGTPEDLKSLVDTAHENGIRVLIDMVHSHAVKNELEGLSRFDGTFYQFFHEGERGFHRPWDSRCFDYGKDMVVKFLLSNLRYWMEEFRVDGFRFDGVTSMLFYDHGLERAFTSYMDYYDDNVDLDALAYLYLANRLVHGISADAVTIAEDMSGYPGIAVPVENGGLGFDYRFAMGIPDFWIKLLKNYRDEAWPLGTLWYELNQKRPEEKTISYAESHDQAFVGDKTIIMHLMGEDIYTAMSVETENVRTFRGVALHKMIRLITFSTASDGYLNFMGNEFGHPEWIDFPSERNNWSYQYARRQWSLRDNSSLYYAMLADFDRHMIGLARRYDLLGTGPAELLHLHESDRVIAYRRGELVFAFNFDPERSYTDYMVKTVAGRYKTVLSTDDTGFGGLGRASAGQVHFTLEEERLSLYLPTRTALVLHRE